MYEVVVKHKQVLRDIQYWWKEYIYAKSQLEKVETMYDKNPMKKDLVELWAGRKKEWMTNLAESESEEKELFSQLEGTLGGE